MKRAKAEQRTKWWKLKKEECCMTFRKELRQALGGQEVLPNDWTTTANVIRETALVAMAAELIQDDLTLTRRVGEEVSFSCGQTHLCDDSGRVLWLQKKETFSGILDINMNDGKISTDYGHSQIDDFSVERKQNVSELKIREVKLSHSASYYCRCFKKVKNDPHSEK
uniref:Ig-like domain-containing protein n=1 Tax=Larimichthys crocea TaxID=215358 RepID=A0A0F8CJ56_LARCR